jgi:hypothetical protein
MMRIPTMPDSVKLARRVRPIGLSVVRSAMLVAAVIIDCLLFAVVLRNSV